MRITKNGEGEYMIITMQHRIMTITEPSEAKEIDLEFRTILRMYLKLRRRQRGISIKR